MNRTITNTTLLENPELCTLATCPLDLAQVQYVPSLAGNMLYIIILCLVAVAQLWLGIKYKTWTYMVSMLFGLIMEVVGYVGRVQMHDNPFLSDPFLMYLTCLTIAPAFFAAAIYLCLSRIVVTYGEEISYLRPRTYTILFISCDFVALMLQSAGGGIASSADNNGDQELGINIMIAGVSWQVFSLALFGVLCAEFAFRVRRTSTSKRSMMFTVLRSTRSFKLYHIALGCATLAIFVRSVFRCAEMSEGFSGKLANDQITFMILEGAMICLSVILLTVLHPGLVWKGQWRDAMWHVRSRAKTQTDYTALEMQNRSASTSV